MFLFVKLQIIHRFKLLRVLLTLQLCPPAGQGDSGLGAEQNQDSGPWCDPAERLRLRSAGGGNEAGGAAEAPLRLLPLAAGGRHPAQRGAAAPAGGGGAGVPGVDSSGSGGPLPPRSEGATPASAGAAESSPRDRWGYLIRVFKTPTFTLVVAGDGLTACGQLCSFLLQSFIPDPGWCGCIWFFHMLLRPLCQMEKLLN